MTDDGHRLRGDVAYLASQPRHRALAGSLERARTYCAQQLIDAGWNVTEQPFVAPNRFRIPDDGKPDAVLPMRPSGKVSGVNLLARASDSNQAGGTLLIAHLDTVRVSPGADDNASGVAVAFAGGTPPAPGTSRRHHRPGRPRRARSARVSTPGHSGSATCSGDLS
ncbi:hypothetical protein BN11_1960032 [Nostocoides australiense Ben110]|uniref:Peptidase M28 domain-containing protein n=1 Tax=Nostocoides australiense Ben110 TaxID=1193182 RepID=W6K2X3_9MICO|nr:hypothetical protein BN11_1960032 [Tetrasphaera australiensis Ben110]